MFHTRLTPGAEKGDGAGLPEINKRVNESNGGRDDLDALS